MKQAELFVALLTAIVLIALAARRFERIPHAVALVLGGIVAGLLPFAPHVNLDPDVVFVGFLPPILYPSSFALATEDVRPDLRQIGVLAFGLVLATIAVIAAAAHLIGGIPWSAALVLGAVLAPTDPVTATAVIRSSGAPARLATILEGESLINDGTALTAVKIAIAAVGGSFSTGGAIGDFVVISFGGAALGAVLALAVVQIRRRLDEPELESLLAILLAYGAFILADHLGMSGVLAVVVAGYVAGRASDIATPATRLRSESFWAVTLFLAESILFLLVGIEFAQVLESGTSRGTVELIGLTALVVAAAVATRTAWMFSAPAFARLLPARLRGPATTPAERAVLSFSGLRGALSMAAALTIPVAVSGTVFPERGAVVAVAIASTVVLLVVPALGLPALLRAVGLTGTDDTYERERRARAALAEAALAETERIGARGEAAERILARLREPFELQLERYEHPDSEPHTDQYRKLRHRTIAAQRARLAELRRDGAVHGELLRTLERELDADELRLR